jgi:hypothetical protein
MTDTSRPVVIDADDRITEPATNATRLYCLTLPRR